MSINEIVCSFITLKKYEKRSGILPFETEKMLDDLMADNASRRGTQPDWVMQK